MKKGREHNEKELSQIRTHLTQTQAQYAKEQKTLATLKAEIIKCLHGESDFSSSVLSQLINESEEKAAQLKEICEIAEAQLMKTEQLQQELYDKYDELISWADLYDSTSHEAKKMIVNNMIKRVDVFRNYKLKIEFDFDIKQFLYGLDCMSEEA